VEASAHGELPSLEIANDVVTARAAPPGSLIATDQLCCSASRCCSAGALTSMRSDHST
jgi:hypothetical protein